MRFWEHFEGKRLTIAHRGHRAFRAENTISAFEASEGLCDFIELDVGFSSDGVAIVIHDDTLERTSNASMVDGFVFPYSVMDYTYKELLLLDVSSWFLRDDPFKTIAQGKVFKEELEALPVQRIPTLKQVLEICKIKNIPVNIEIKDMQGTKMHAAATHNIVSIIQELGMKNMILLSSFNHTYLSQVKDIDPTISIAILQETRLPQNPIKYLQQMRTWCCNIGTDIATPKIIDELVRAGVIVNVFTVNSQTEQENLYKLGVRGIFTDFLREI